MSKSTPTSSTTFSLPNPLQTQQGQYLGALWGDARRMSGGGGEPLVGQTALDLINQTTARNYGMTAAPAAEVMPNAANFASQILAGRYPQASMPAGPQMQNLDQLGGMASGAGTNYGNQIAGAAYGAPGAVSPNVGGLNSLAGQLSGLAPAAMGVANPAMSGLYGNAGMAVSGNPIFDSLRGMASGQYIDPSRNPALAGTLQAATQPLVNQYMTSIAPQIDSNVEGGGRYGSGVQANMRGQAQYGLGQALGSATSNIVNNAYNTGIQSALGAGSALGQAYNTGIGNISNALTGAGQLGQAGVQNAGNLFSAGANALQAGGQLALGGQQALTSGLAGAAGAANQGYGTGANAYNQAGALANAGALGLGSIAQMAPEMANYPLTQLQTQYNNQWQPIQNYASLLGQPVQGTPSSTSTQGSAQSNVGSQVASGLSSLASLAMLFKI